MKPKYLIWGLTAIFLCIILSDLPRADVTSAGSASGSTLITELKDPDPNVRIRATEEAGKTRSFEAVKPLIHILLYDDVWNVRKSAAWALGEIGDAQAVFPLIRALSHKDWIIRSRAAEALGKIGDKTAVAALTDLLQEENDHVTEKAVWALGEIRQQRSVVPLLEKLEDDIPDIRAAAALALGKIGDSSAVPSLTTLLKNDRNPEVRKSVARAFGEIQDAAILQPLAEALADDDYAVRLHAQASVEKTGIQAVPFLIETLTNEKPYARNRAMWALEKITGEKYGEDASRWKTWRDEKNAIGSASREDR